MGTPSFFTKFIPLRWRKSVPVVNHVVLNGAIGIGTPMRPALTLKSVNGILERAFRPKGLAAVAISVNSPGGSPVQSALIHARIRELAEEKKVPVLVFCEDVVRLAEAIGYDPRIGNRFLAAGLGFGGGCLPKDIRAFMARAGEIGAQEAVTFLREVDEINLRRRAHTVELARTLLGGSFRGRRVTVLGATFKPDSDDVRDSPSLDVAVAISNAGADVVVHDPKGLVNAERVYPHLTYQADLRQALANAELVVHGTEWREYRDIDPSDIADVVAGRIVIDARNTLDPIRWRQAGWTYRALGRPTA